MKKNRNRSREQATDRQRNKGGRPAIITAAVVEEVAALMAGGVPEHFACALVGVNPETFGPAVSRTPQFRAIKDRHDARFIAASVKIIREGGEKIQLQTGTDETGAPVMTEKVLPWTGRAWLLERRYKPHFNKTDTHALTDGAGKDKALEADLVELEKVMKKAILGS